MAFEVADPSSLLQGIRGGNDPELFISEQSFDYPAEFDRYAVYVRRVEELRILGEEDEITLRQSSLLDFSKFIRRTPHLPRASLVLTNIGNIRAIWKGRGERQIAIHFRGAGRVTFAAMWPESQDESFGERRLDELNSIFQDFPF